MRPMAGLTLANAIFLLLVYLSDRLLGERTVGTLLIAALPPLLFLVPGFLLLALSLRSWKLAVVNGVVLVVAAMGIAGLRVSLGSRESADLRIMSFNVQHGDKGMEGLARLILEVDPDVVCIQEGSKEVESSLRKRIPAYTSIRHESMITLTKRPVLGVRTWPPLRGKRRPIQMVTIQGPAPVAFYNVHLEPSRIESHLTGGLFQHLREWENLQRKELEAISLALSDGPLVLCGDFNRLPNGVRYEWFTRRLRDAHDEAGSGFGNTIPAAFPFRRIDWILVSRDWHVVRAFVPAEIASDHRAMVADLKLLPDR